MVQDLLKLSVNKYLSILSILFVQYLLLMMAIGFPSQSCALHGGAHASNDDVKKSGQRKRRAQKEGSFLECVVARLDRVETMLAELHWNTVGQWTHAAWHEDDWPTSGYPSEPTATPPTISTTRTREKQASTLTFEAERQFISEGGRADPLLPATTGERWSKNRNVRDPEEQVRTPNVPSVTISEDIVIE